MDVAVDQGKLYGAYLVKSMLGAVSSVGSHSQRPYIIETMHSYTLPM